MQSVADIQYAHSRVITPSAREPMMDESVFPHDRCELGKKNSLTSSWRAGGSDSGAVNQGNACVW